MRDNITSSLMISVSTYINSLLYTDLQVLPAGKASSVSKHLASCTMLRIYIQKDQLCSKSCKGDVQNLTLKYST